MGVAGKAMHQRVSAVRMMFSMIVADRGCGGTQDGSHDRGREIGAVEVCTVWGVAKGRRDEHLLFECIAASVVELREGVEAAVEKKVSRLVRPGPGGEAIMVPWRLDITGRSPNVEVMAEVGAALGNVLGAETPAKGFRRLHGARDEAGNWSADSWR